MIRDAVTCDRTDCMAIYLEPIPGPTTIPGQDNPSTLAEDVLEFDQLAQLAGWVQDDKTGHSCPACVAGRGPVLELGECPTCTGGTTDRADSSICLYCRTLIPFSADEI